MIAKSKTVIGTSDMAERLTAPQSPCQDTDDSPAANPGLLGHYRRLLAGSTFDAFVLTESEHIL
jgi:hypothetical protein